MINPFDYSFTDISDQHNPYRPGSDAWHKHNLGIGPGVIGVIGDVVVIDEHGLLVSGWFFGEEPPPLQAWRIDGDTARPV